MPTGISVSEGSGEYLLVLGWLDKSLYERTREGDALIDWQWEEVHPAHSGTSGDLAKLFKNEHVKVPGVFQVNAPTHDETLMTREVIQNSWDAARELRTMLVSEGVTPPDFEISFNFEALTGQGKADFSNRLGLHGLSSRLERLDRRKVGLKEGLALDSLSDETPLNLLRIYESGASGMFGPWRNNESKMFLALVSLGLTAKESGAGGSYGYGKAGLIRGSGTRTVLAYSCFRERPDDPGVTRRLLGMTYWGQHDLDGGSFSGFARHGVPSGEGGVKPFENEEADEVARGLGFETRSADDLLDLGTSYLLVDPTVSPEGLLRAIERNWWPAIEEHKTFNAEVCDYAGNILDPRPKKDPVLRTFIRAREVALTPEFQNAPDEHQPNFQSHELSTGEKIPVGRMGLVSSIDDWSYPAIVRDDDGREIQQRSLVALMRSPGMVVEYFEGGQRPPFVRGAFVGEGKADDLLRQTEPKAHDAWETQLGDDPVDPDAPAVATTVDTRIRNHVGIFRKTLKPPVPERKEMRLPELEKLFKDLLDGEGSRGKPIPKGEPRTVAISMLEQSPALDRSNPNFIRMTARVGFNLTDAVEDDEAEVRVSLNYKFVEDDRAGDLCALDIKAPFGFFPEEGGDFVGRLGRKRVVFEIESDAYDPDWSGRLVAAADLNAEEVVR